MAQEQGYFGPLIAKMTAWVREDRPDGLIEREVETLRRIVQGATNAARSQPPPGLMMPAFS